MEQLKKCPFCGVDGIYELILTNSIGDSEPALFCNACKMTFQVENDSPYMNADETYIYLREKLYKKFNIRKPMERIVERLEKEAELFSLSEKDCVFAIRQNKAISFVKEEMS